jgi:hypothetical protein
MSIIAKIMRITIITVLLLFTLTIVAAILADLISAVFLSQEPSYEEGCELLFSEDCL